MGDVVELYPDPTDGMTPEDREYRIKVFMEDGGLTRSEAEDRINRRDAGLPAEAISSLF